MWITRLPHEVRLVSIINMACNERYGSVLGCSREGGGCAPLSGKCSYTMTDRRWSSNGGAAEVSPEFAMDVARCIDEVGALTP